MSQTPRLPRSSAAILVALAIAIALPLSTRSTAQGGLAPHLTYRDASIAETRFDDFDLTLTGRDVRLRITVAGLPPCLGRTSLLEYGFMMDADRSPATGRADALFSPLGVDARISARCDPQTGQFVGRVANLNVKTASGSGDVHLDIGTTVDRLPAAAFHWFAYAIDGTTFVRLPDVADYGAWAVFEASVF